MKTKNREVEPTRRQAAVHTGMKALGFSESAPPKGILFPARSPASHDGSDRERSTAPGPACSAPLFLPRTERRVNLRARGSGKHSQRGGGIYRK